MIKGKVRTSIGWAIVLIWMVVIFLFSAQNGTQSSDLSGSCLQVLLDFFHISTDQMDFGETILRKGAHFSEYFVLSILLMDALRLSGISWRNRIWLAPVLSAVYAITDEIHQYFIPGRAMRAFDVWIDTCGAAVGVLLYGIVRRMVRAVKRRRRGRNEE